MSRYARNNSVLESRDRRHAREDRERIKPVPMCKSGSVPGPTVRCGFASNQAQLNRMKHGWNSSTVNKASGFFKR